MERPKTLIDKDTTPLNCLDEFGKLLNNLMSINDITIIGLIAGTCTTISFIPQVIKTIKTKETKDISIAMYIILIIGILFWIIYGILIRDFPVILANSIAFLLTTIILILKIKYS
jgi:MtN3 and saliva related transmembrane protein